ncbi:response regulator transcription factor [Actinomyces slackii]|uniref:Sensory transduction protein regX3 n=1 Tax=Actinomyces slackii TaxID=52774 RepID=A0A3S4SDR7_9ACTO|nr:response regulator transcription factor [Actinomyces slackii]VEG73735.1 Sensory transduction protein regX3 [Actinomyces slackii]
MSADTEVLLVEDEADLAAAVRDYLEAFGLSVHHCPDAESALAAASWRAPGVVLLDVGLPGMSGYELCRRLRAISQVPIIFVSARASDVDQVQGLSLGGDDYVTKPFSLAVLLAKVRRALERTAAGGTAPAVDQADDPADPADPAGPPPTPGFDDGRLRVEASTGRTYLDGDEVHLTALEDRILRHLVAHRGAVRTKEEIIRAVWGDEYTSEGTLSAHMRRLRTRVEPDPDSPTYIRTVWGRGYLFEAP